MNYDIDYYKDEIHCLQEENFNLREENAHLGMLNCDLERYLKEHKARINKAIEYIEDYLPYLEMVDYEYEDMNGDTKYVMKEWEGKELLDILKGSDKE